MNNVRNVQKINERELQLGLSGASWHDEFKDSAYVFVGGLNTELTEGDVITICSQYGEVMDIDMPRNKETGKPRGFAFVMYEDQRSTVLAVDNLNGANVLNRTLAVNHVKDYKQRRTKGEDGEWIEADEQSLNAKPVMVDDAASDSGSSASSGPAIDPEDPMAEYLLAQRREQKALKKPKSGKSKGKRREDESPEERRARKARKREKKERKEKKGRSAGVKGVEALLSSLGGAAPRRRSRTRSPSRTPEYSRRSKSRSPFDRGRSRSFSPAARPRYRSEPSDEDVRRRSRSPADRRRRYDDDDGY